MQARRLVPALTALLLGALGTVAGSAGAQNAALGKAAYQSSTWSGTFTYPGNAVDGDTDGDFWNGHISHTALDDDAWWYVDLGEAYDISSITLWNRTDCCAERLSDFFVAILAEGSTNVGAELAPTVWREDFDGTAGRTTTFTPPEGTQGRYVKVQLDGHADYLSLAEVEVTGTPVPPPVSPDPTAPNVALGKDAYQSSTWSGTFTYPENAVDGITDGNFWGGSITHTALDRNPWWYVDLGETFDISSIVLWNRTDCCQERLSNFFIAILADGAADIGALDAPVVWSMNVSNAAGTKSYFMPPPGTQGRYVKVQLDDHADYLSLAEVQVFGRPVSVTPEPGTLALLAGGLGLLGVTRGRRRRAERQAVHGATKASGGAVC
jgi:hypothetical protein